MTIVTKPLSEKKEEKNQEPLVGEVKVLVPEQATGSGKKGNYSREHVRQIIKTRVLPTYISIGFLLSLLLICLIPILATMLRDAVREKLYHDWCSIPYEDLSPENAMHQADQAHLNIDLNNNIFDQFKKFAHSVLGDKSTDRFFREEFEIDEVSEKITVPDFSGGRRSRFIHDFRTNKTGIIDLDGHRCFVLPLNRSAVLPPGGLMDLIKKMNSGYYDVNTSILRETMRVVTPAIENRADLGTYIMTECYGYPIYKLEKFVSSVYKRSASVDEGKFIVFSGKGTQELRIVNYGDLADHEVDGPIAMA